MAPLLLIDDEFRNELATAASECKESLTVFAGYMISTALIWLAEQLPRDVTQVDIVAGWSMADLVTGASDLESYPLAKSMGWRFGILPGMHAKIYCIDHTKLLIGSANLTLRGLQLTPHPNIEAGVHVHPSDIDKTKIQKLLDATFWLDETTYSDIRNKVELAKEQHQKLDIDWPPSLEHQLESREIVLWVDDCFLTSPLTIRKDNELWNHDRWLLQAIETDADDSAALSDAFRRTKMFRWLSKLFNSDQSGALRFGRISAALHDSLIDDPKPYRKDVKQLVANLFDWIEFCDLSEVEIKQHKRTRSLKLIS